MSTVTWVLTLFVRAVRMQMVGERLPSFLLGFALGPIVSIVYVLMARGAGRPDLEAFVTLTPIAVAMWGTASLTAGDAISLERAAGTLELLVAAPAPPAVAVIGRITGTIVLSLIAIPETILIASFLGVSFQVTDPSGFFAAVLVLAFSTVGIGLITASAFVLANGARLYVNLVTFPV